MLVAYTPTSPPSKLMHLAEARLFTMWYRAALRVDGNGDFDGATCFLLNSNDTSTVVQK